MRIIYSRLGSMSRAQKNISDFYQSLLGSFVVTVLLNNLEFVVPSFI